MCINTHECIPHTPCVLKHLRLHVIRYEVHHGVRIEDAALVAAAVMSDRYIADRYVCEI